MAAAAPPRPHLGKWSCCPGTMRGHRPRHLWESAGTVYGTRSADAITLTLMDYGIAVVAAAAVGTMGAVLGAAAAAPATRQTAA